MASSECPRISITTRHGTFCSDFTIVMRVRHRFGDLVGEQAGRAAGADEVNVDSAAPYIGLAEDFPFTCPNVDRSDQSQPRSWASRAAAVRLVAPSLRMASDR